MSAGPLPKARLTERNNFRDFPEQPSRNLRMLSGSVYWGGGRSSEGNFIARHIPREERHRGNLASLGFP